MCACRYHFLDLLQEFGVKQAVCFVQYQVADTELEREQEKEIILEDTDFERSSCPVCNEETSRRGVLTMMSTSTYVSTGSPKRSKITHLLCLAQLCQPAYWR
jgi:hypothetical protein